MAEWQRLLSAGWVLLTTRHRAAAEVLAAGLRVIVPVEADPGSGGLSATSAEAFGAVAISTPGDPHSFAVGLLHECQHSLLNATTSLFDLVTPGGPRVCSPWRDDPRPLSGLLHGAYAYLSVTRFRRTEAATRVPAPRRGPVALTPHPLPAETSVAHLPAAEPPVLTETGPRGPAAGSAGLRGRLAEFEFARWRAAVAEAAGTLLDSGQLTAAGTRFVRAMRDEAAGWLSEPVDPRVARLAAGANAEHRARWRLRNLEVDPAAVAELVAAWRRGAAAPAVPEAGLAADRGRQLESSERLRLVHRLLNEGDHRGRAGSGLRPGDDAYLDGDAGTAATSYSKGLAFSSDLDRWSGLAVVSSHAAMRDRPELVRAVTLAAAEAGEVRNVGPEAVAAWLSGSLMSA
ncbi:aKG-HExxH-type peptide beta-hydroxylase [Paractinoplanes durhamensis]|uniref:aKG-HExxH-type peptide beta-hydroxylase n=1 Tax=Paractinoplanes durhamensis TaxID=113563 RepID=UPI00364550E8